jgi:hypothetical protein
MALGHPHDLLVAAGGTGPHTGALASLVTLGGFACLFAWVTWRFGPTLMRFCGLASWWAGWACGSQGGYGYMVLLVSAAYGIEPTCSASVSTSSDVGIARVQVADAAL